MNSSIVNCKCCAEANFAIINKVITIAHYQQLNTCSANPGTYDCV